MHKNRAGVRKKKETSICALEADRRGIHSDWPMWPLGSPIEGTWEWLFDRVGEGVLPDVPCQWCEFVGKERSVIYWLNTRKRTRHIIVGYGARILTVPADLQPQSNSMH
jgi:hypothetical protein